MKIEQILDEFLTPTYLKGKPESMNVIDWVISKASTCCGKCKLMQEDVSEVGYTILESYGGDTCPTIDNWISHVSEINKLYRIILENQSALPCNLLKIEVVE